MRKSDYIQQYVLALAPQFYDNTNEALRLANESVDILEGSGVSFDDSPKILDTELCDLGLSVRSLNVLRSMDVFTFKELLNVDKSLIKKRYGCGKSTMDELEKLAKHYGYELKD